MKRAAIYARVSTVDRGQDPETQLRQLREYAEQLTERFGEGWWDIPMKGPVASDNMKKLREDIRARCREASSTLSTKGEAFLADAARLEDRTESILAVIGYPTTNERDP